MAFPDEIGIGIVGIHGDAGGCSENGFRDIEGVTLKAVCDFPQQLTEYVATFNHLKRLAAYTDWKELVDDPTVDLVAVAVPDADHCTLAEYAVRQDKYVFVEKPLTNNRADLDRFRLLAEKHGERILFGEKYSHANPVLAALKYRQRLGTFLSGNTDYIMWRCDRIMGDGMWRRKFAHNSCAGGQSHNFMTMLLLTGMRISRICCTYADAVTYTDLKEYGGNDIMKGMLELTDGINTRQISWESYMAVKGSGTPYANRTVAHRFMYTNGSLVYGPRPEHDLFVVGEKPIFFDPEPDPQNWNAWQNYIRNTLYMRMHNNIIGSLRGTARALHTIQDALDVTDVCIAAMESAQCNGGWIHIG